MIIEQRAISKPGVGLEVRVAGLGSSGSELQPPSTIELTPGGVDSTRHPSEVDKMRTSVPV